MTGMVCKELLLDGKSSVVSVMGWRTGWCEYSNSVVARAHRCVLTH